MYNNAENRLKKLEKEVIKRNIKYKVQKLDCCNICKFNNSTNRYCKKHKIKNNKQYGICNDYIFINTNTKQGE
jgi:hypothetical protein